jgi:hypothetical protein
MHNNMTPGETLLAGAIAGAFWALVIWGYRAAKTKVKDKFTGKGDK